MKIFLSRWWLATIPFVLPQISVAETYFVQDSWLVEGNQSIQAGDTAIIKSGNQITLAESATLTINSGAKLLIEPGVDIKAGAKAKITVQGQLVAEGTASKQINFGDHFASSTKNQWRGIEVIDSGRVKLRHTHIQNAGFGLLSLISTKASQLVFDIKDSRFENNIYGIYIRPKLGVESTVLSYFEINYNTFNNNDINLSGSQSEVREDYYITAINALYNWWGTNDKAEIAAKIYDHSDYNLWLPIDYGHHLYLSSTPKDPIESTDKHTQDSWITAHLADDE